MPGRFVELADAVAGFGELLEGGGDQYPESDFYMMGGLKECFEKGAKM